MCDRVCVSVRICGADQEWLMEAEGRTRGLSSVLLLEIYNFSPHTVSDEHLLISGCSHGSM